MEQPLTVIWAAKLFYPEEMKGIDMEEELKIFLKKILPLWSYLMRNVKIYSETCIKA